MARTSTWSRLRALEQKIPPESFKFVLVVHDIIDPIPELPDPERDATRAERKAAACDAVSAHANQTGRVGRIVWDRRAADGLGDFEVL
jgi:hypothetical protein